jgi:hypothetical protein
LILNKNIKQQEIKMQDYNYEPAESEPYDIEAAEAYDDYMADQHDVEKDRLGE